MDLYTLLAGLFLVLIAGIAILNSLTFPGLRPVAAGEAPPRVSLLVPARDEARQVTATLSSLLGQDYPAFEVILLDDGSRDRTAQLALEAAGADPRFRLLAGADLPQGWRGKNWACQQLAEAARGDLLVFTDADVTWRPEALSALVAEMRRSRADLLTVWPTQRTHTWSERLVVPLMAFTVMAYLPAVAVHHIPWPVFSAANGQCLAFRREAYRALGGHDGLRGALVEDMAFAAAAKRGRLRLRMADGAGLLSTRMYAGWTEVRDGFAKNLLSGHGGSLAFLAFSTAFHWALFVVPWLAAGAAALAGGDPLPGLVLGILGLLVRALTAAATRQRPLDALGLPISVLLMTRIAIRSAAWGVTGGVRWKGRSYGR